MKKMAVLYVVIILAFIFALSSGAYVAWNVADPEYTCAQCHEIKPTHEKWSKSAHADVAVLLYPLSFPLSSVCKRGGGRR